MMITYQRQVNALGSSMFEVPTKKRFHSMTTPDAPITSMIPEPEVRSTASAGPRSASRSVSSGPTVFRPNRFSAQIQSTFPVNISIGNGTINLSTFANMPSISSEMDNVQFDSPHQHFSNASYPVSIPNRRLQMYRESERLKTYRNWNVSFLPPQIMARAGFYFTGHRDIVKCPFCDVEVMNWEDGDDPWDDHRKWKPTCKFINDEPGHGNIPVSQERTLEDRNGAVTPPSPNDSGYDTCGSQEIRGMDVLRSMFRGTPEEGSSTNPSVIYRMKSPAFPMYSSVENRLASFSSWPVSLKIKPNVLTEAGFYYTGKGDQTVCFYCGGGLKDWEDTDDPWTEHAKWFSKCTYVLLNKGEQFVEQAKAAPNGVKVEDKLLTDKQATSDKTSEVNSEVASCSGAGNQDDAMMCKLCYSKPLQVVFLPCGHLMSCIECSLKLKQCGVCRSNITSVVRTFLP